LVLRLEADLVDRLADLVHDRLRQLESLCALEPLHRGNHPDHQQGDEQDQADVLDRSLSPLPTEEGEPPPDAGDE
jgi:hypothetical protein